MNFSSADHQHMARALQLAERGLYTTRPNPRVGCVLVKEGVVVGEGYHRRAGGPHAEVEALQAAGEQARGATAYVSLEPCSHFGRTPPCADALVEAGVARVVAAMEDPNPRVAGQGLRRLQEAGIEVVAGLMAAEAEALNVGFVSRMRRGRPWVRVKLASSLDGRTAMASGESKWITSAAARRDVHRLRARSDAVVTGIGTVLADDPSLTVRDFELPAAGSGQPLRVVLDRGLRFPAAARMLGCEGETLIVYGPEAASRDISGAELLRLSRPDIGAVLELLAQREINEVLVESGPTLAGACVMEGWADELVFYMAPHLMGHDGAPLLRLPGIGSMAERIGLDIIEVRSVGPDLRITAKPSQAAG